MDVLFIAVFSQFPNKVVPKYELPVMAEWLGNQYPLCPISVDNDKGIEDAGTYTLQVCVCVFVSVCACLCVSVDVHVALCACMYICGTVCTCVYWKLLSNPNFELEQHEVERVW